MGFVPLPLSLALFRQGAENSSPPLVPPPLVKRGAFPFHVILSCPWLTHSSVAYPEISFKDASFTASRECSTLARLGFYLVPFIPSVISSQKGPPSPTPAPRRSSYRPRLESLYAACCLERGVRRERKSIQLVIVLPSSLLPFRRLEHKLRNGFARAPQADADNLHAICSRPREGMHKRDRPVALPPLPDVGNKERGMAGRDGLPSRPFEPN